MSRLFWTTFLVLARRELAIGWRRAALGLVAPAVALAAWALTSAAAPDRGATLAGFAVLAAALAAVIANAERDADRRAGFARLVRVSGAPPLAAALGTTLGVATLAAGAAALVLGAAPLAPFTLGPLQGLGLLAAVGAGALPLAALTGALATTCRRPRTYWLAAVGGLLVLWLGSGVLAPLGDGAGVTAWAFANPLAQAAGLIDAALRGAWPPGDALGWTLAGLALWLLGGLGWAVVADARDAA